MDPAMIMRPEVRLDPFPMYAALRAGGAVQAFGVWNVFRYDDVRMVLSDHGRFLSGGPEQPGERRSLIMTNPPRHTRLRGLVNRAFTPRAVADLEPRIAALSGQLLDKAAGGTFDLIGDLAAPLPVMVIAEMLGIPPEDRDRFKVWSDAVVASADSLLGGPGGQRRDHGPGEAMSEMWRYFEGVLAERRASPRADLISALLSAEEDGARLADEDVLHFCWLLLVAGNETTTNLIGNAARCLLEQPDLEERLRGEPALLPSFVEEVLRYRSPVQAMFRVAAEPVEIAGHSIAAGSRIIAWIGSANRDAQRFADPDRFDPARSPNPHIAFGYGVHFCLGAPLARLEARVALSALLRRFARFERAKGDAPLQPVEGFIVHGVKHLALAVTPAG